VEETGKSTGESGGTPVAGVRDDTRRVSAQRKQSKDETVTCDLSEMDFSTLRPSSFRGRGRGMRAPQRTERQQGISHKVSCGRQYMVSRCDHQIILMSNVTL